MKILLVVYDNGSHISYFPLGTAYVASACRNAGHDVTIYNQDVFHWPESHLTALLNKEHFDVIGLGVVGGYYQYRKLLKVSEAINASKDRPFYVLGGHCPSPEPEYFLRKTRADAVVIGEGEVTVVELLEALELKTNLASVEGIAFLREDKCVQTPRRKVIQNVDSIPHPAWDLFPIEHYALMRAPNVTSSDRYMSVLSGRGCPFKCNFCYRMDPGFRPRSATSIIDEIKVLKEDYHVSYIEFTDELFMSSVERTVQLCNSFIKEGLNIKWYCEGRLNFAKPAVLRLMKEAGCVFINYGIESLDQAALINMNKGLSVRQVTEGVENTLAVGISPGLNIIFGNIGETLESLELGVDFLLKYDDHAQLRTIRPVTPYPGSPLYYYAIEKGLLNDCQDFYERKHINSDLLSVNFTDMPNDDFHRGLYEANKVLITTYFNNKLERSLDEAADLYFNLNKGFRGFRQT
jgi:anaerobic magnesium-protoporphyrin IX monomethyl ester cyclase